MRACVAILISASAVLRRPVSGRNGPADVSMENTLAYSVLQEMNCFFLAHLRQEITDFSRGVLPSREGDDTNMWSIMVVIINKSVAGTVCHSLCR